MLQFYKSVSGASGLLLRALLHARSRKGKELPAHLGERQGRASLARGNAPLIWVHAASIGEAQSALILVERLQRLVPGTQILMTTGTVSSANMMRKNLPAGAMHQFYPVDHPAWTKQFLDHWRPELVLWMESELWPNMLIDIKSRGIPAILVNARLSEKSFRRWSWFGGAAKEVLGAFSLILAQGEKEAARFRALGAANVIATGNIKYSAKPLSFSETDLKAVGGAIGQRPVWLYASSHKGEESLACRVHQKLKLKFPDLLTIIVPRHPERRQDIIATCEQANLKFILRGEIRILPSYDTDIYIADTFGELGLFYRLAPLACIGRSFSDDGGGGHNPIEAAQLNCAVLYGPNVQFQKELFEEMSNAGGALGVNTESELEEAVGAFLSNPQKLAAMQQNGLEFTRVKSRVVDIVIESIAPWLDFSAEKTGTRPWH
ncbi:MAG: 3-deoxy-D-manno-octulosonic acid transferase [Alphaproteobacteria bacterium PRO2]|nr:3-deoxy-D-manno-octulosonic acid transferase [Alphaproteobacteria bacterium PRO2]